MRTATFDLDGVEIDAQKLLARPSDFGWFGDKDRMFQTWALGPVIEHRDSGLLAKSNARVLKRELARAAAAGEIEPESWEIVGCSHWAVGHVDHLSYRVLDDAGQPTKIARWLQCWHDALDSYPVASDDDYSEVEHEALGENIRSCAESCRATRGVVADLPEGWEWDVVRWFDEIGDQSATENTDDQGGWPSDEQITDAFRGLGYLPAEEADDED